MVYQLVFIQSKAGIRREKLSLGVMGQGPVHVPVFFTDSSGPPTLFECTDDSLFVEVGLPTELEVAAATHHICINLEYN